MEINTKYQQKVRPKVMEWVDLYENDKKRFDQYEQ